VSSACWRGRAEHDEGSSEAVHVERYSSCDLNNQVELGMIRPSSCDMDDQAGLSTLKVELM